MDYLHQLREIFKPLVNFDEATWTASEPSMSIQKWHGGQSVLRAGENISPVYFLVQGCAYYSYVSPTGKESIKSFVMPGGVLTSMTTLLYQKPSPFDIRSLQDSVTVAMNYTDILTLGERFTAWNLLHRKLLEQLALKKERREASLLMLSARERYEEFMDEFGELNQFIPLNKIALYLGITDVALSRIRKQMNLTQVK